MMNPLSSQTAASTHMEEVLMNCESCVLNDWEVNRRSTDGSELDVAESDSVMMTT